MLAFDGEEEVAVLEMGMSQLGEISLLAEIAKPEIAVITNVGKPIWKAFFLLKM